MNYMGWLAHGFLQVPNHEILALINRKELAQTCSKLYISKLIFSLRYCRSTLCFLVRGLILRSLCRRIILKV